MADYSVLYEQPATRHQERPVEKPAQPPGRIDCSGGRLQSPRARPTVLRKYANFGGQCSWCVDCFNGLGGTNAEAFRTTFKKWTTTRVPRDLREQAADWTAPGCLGIHTTLAELLGNCISASRLANQRIEHVSAQILNRSNLFVPSFQGNPANRNLKAVALALAREQLATRCQRATGVQDLRPNGPSIAVGFASSLRVPIRRASRPLYLSESRCLLR